MAATRGLRVERNSRFPSPCREIDSQFTRCRSTAQNNNCRDLHHPSPMIGPATAGILNHGTRPTEDGLHLCASHPTPNPSWSSLPAADEKRTNPIHLQLGRQHAS